MHEVYAAIFLILFAFFLIWLFYYIGKSGRWRTPEGELSKKDRLILASKVRFYKELDEEQKKHFEYKVSEFLANVKITGVSTKVRRTDELLIASSGIIPIFHFADWQYLNLDEVLLYDKSFNDSFQTGDNFHGSHNISGMVGNGFLNGKMILSKTDLHHGFSNEWDGYNVGIHEFVHLIDKADGSVDGVPEIFLQKQYVLPWLELMHKNIDEIAGGRSDINPYGATDKTEFFAVASEYFFENPKRFKAKHPELFELMEKMFRVKE
ncbi:MAG: zinc-dependent peptidase [Candidatus Delongbacteria bacterium]|nr:zinc-dependent peptidase [Candidatus Delongbacteria bacterium]